MKPFYQQLDEKYGKAECTEIDYRDFRIYGRPGYYRYGTRYSGMTVKRWKTLRGIKAAIDRLEYSAGCYADKAVS